MRRILTAPLALLRPVRRIARAGSLRARLLAGLAALLAATGGFFVALTPSCAGGACPSLHDLDDYRPPEPPHIYARDGTLAGHLPGPRRIGVRLDQVPDFLARGFVAVEDRRFREHGGVDLRAAGRALVRNLAAGRVVEGASTLTMQLARNVFGPDLLEYSKWRRKAAEVRLALSIEARLDKDEILELYLNQIYLGDGVYGVGTAARHYFGQPASDLTPSQAALLVALARSPEGYNPRRHPRKALTRRDVVLDVWVREGVITEGRARTARRAALELARARPVWDAGSYYAAAVQRDVARLLPDPRERAGVRVHTALDPGLQRRAEEVLATRIRWIEEGRFGPYPHPVPERDAGSGEQAPTAGEPPDASPHLQGMVVSMDPTNGAIRALVGGRSFARTQFDRALLARRQPGSAFKPVVFSAALSEGVTHAHLVSLDSVRVLLDPDSASAWRLAARPGGEEGRHHLTIRDALVYSSNVATVRVGMRLGVPRVADQARALGISSPIPPWPSIFLGTAEVVPAELVAAYAAFGNGGFRVTPHLVTRIEDPRGRVLWASPPTPSRALDPRVAHLTLDALRDVVDRGTGWRVRARGFDAPAAGKTGTTNRGRDVWFVGMTPGLATGVWLGFDEPKPILPGASGGRLAAPVWARLMEGAAPDHLGDAGAWTAPAGVVRARIDESTGYLANRSCPVGQVREELFLEGSAPEDYCPLHGRNLLERIAAELKAVFGRETDRMLRLPPP